jgi:hypothetical protein
MYSAIKPQGKAIVLLLKVVTPSIAIFGILSPRSPIVITGAHVVSSEAV